MIQLHYATHDGVELLADLYVPGGAGPHPVVVGISGGGWRIGSRADLSGWGAYLDSQGFALCAVDHRKSNAAACYPQAVCDVVSAMQYLAGEQERLNIDAERMALMGSSAGAHLASLAALAVGGGEFASGYPGDRHAGLRPRVRAMVLAYGVYDLVAQWQHGLVLNQAPGEDRVTRFLGTTPFADPELYHRASPLRRITYDCKDIKTYLIWGDEDEVVPPSQSRAFATALSQAGYFVRTCVVKGAGHFWYTDDPIADQQGFAAFVAPRVVRFLRQVFSM